MRATLFSAFFFLLTAGCDEDYPDIEVLSDAFGYGEIIPERYTCDGDELSPPLSFEGLVPEAVSVAVIMDDPDASGGTFNHWLIWGITMERRFLEQGLPNLENPADDLRQGKNGANLLGYTGPCPPKGEGHRYYFKGYALDTALDLKGGSDRKKLLDAMDGHIVGYGELKGLYERL